MTDWLAITVGQAPLIVSLPHAGTVIPADITGLYSHELARRDADHHVDQLYAFAADLGATIVHSRVSRTVIDLNRDPSGQSLYPGQATTGLCPVTTFDGEPLYVTGSEPAEAEIARRRSAYFDPYHAALAEQIARLRALHPTVVVYDAHSIRSYVPRLFEGELPQFNLGTNGGATCSPSLEAMLAQVCDKSGHSWTANGRFKGGWITRHYGMPKAGIHAVQMELAQRGYMDEVPSPDAANSPGPLHTGPAVLPTLRALIGACLTFAEGSR